jgi:glycine/D-amino acid oxidase-like deaminating enzyme
MHIGIVGCGIFGASAALTLAQRGHRVTVFDRGGPPADDAASADRSKALRFEYGAHCATYVPLVEESRAAYRALAADHGAPLYVETGVLALARAFDAARHERLSYDFLRAAGRPIALLDPRVAERRFPQFAWEGIAAGTWNPEGGYVRALEAVRATVAAARALGAEIRGGARVADVDERPGAAIVELDGGEAHEFDAVLVCAGPWLGRFLPAAARAARVRPTRQFVTWYRPPSATQAALFEPAAAPTADVNGFPVWMHDVTDSGWYGMPLQEGLLKVARHEPGEDVDPDAPRLVTDGDREASRAFVAAHVPAIRPEWYAEDLGCLYAMTDDGHFLIDRVPGASALFVAGGGSGHGFKMGPAVGRMAADCVEAGGAEAAGAAKIAAEFRAEAVRSGRVA